MKKNLTTQNPRPGTRLLALALMVGAVALAPVCARAVIVGPYSRDADTLHLWHLNESAVPALDSIPDGTNLTALVNGATLGNAAYDSSFGNSLSTAPAISAYLAARPLAGNTTDDTAIIYADPTTGAFTYEALLRIDFDPATNFSRTTPLSIITGENDSTVSTRAFQWRILPKGMVMAGTTTTDYRLHFYNAKDNGGYFAVLPLSGPNGLAVGAWYHVAVTYDGNEGVDGNMKLYWTRLEASRVQADELSAIKLGVGMNDLNATAPDFAIGNVGRSTLNASFLGQIDEVRLSKSARSATGMMFNTTKPEVPVSIDTHPASQTVAVGQPAGLSVLASGTEPLAYQWRFDGSPIAGASQSVYAIASAQLTNTGNYTVVVTNAFNAVTSTVAALTVQQIPVSIVTDPVSLIVAIGQPASFSVLVSGSEPLAFQWRLGGSPIAGATQSIYSIASALSGDAGTYDVVVTNRAPSSATSAGAILTVRTPVNLTWLGSASSDWDTFSTNWDMNADMVADTAYTPGDNVLFDNNGAAAWVVNLGGLFNPNSVVVSADTDYLFQSAVSGGIGSSGGLTKQGAGTLTLDIDNTYTGPTLIQNGKLTVGVGDIVGVGATHGSLGTGPITNQAILRFDREGTLTMTNSIAGNGALVKDNSLNLRLLGANTMSGDITVNRGYLTVGPAGLGNATSITLNGVGGGDGTTLVLTTNAAGNGTVVGAAVNLTCNPVDVSNRAGLLNEAGTNVFDGAMLMSGAGPMMVRVAAGALEVNGPISGAGFTDALVFRGQGTNNIIRSQITVPNAFMQKDDAGTWLLNSAGHSFLHLRMILGTFKLGNHNVLPMASYVKTDGGTLDLAGFNQTVSGLVHTRVAAAAIANSSTTSDSRLSVVTAPADPPWVSGVVIADSTAGGTRKVSLSLSGGATLVLTNVSTYSGDTTISAGTLALSGNGALANSTPISLAAGTTLDASGRADGTLILGASQVLKGNGAFNVVGSLANNGTIELKVNKAGATLSNDSISGLTAITYGGTLQLNITASPALTTSDSFKLFYAGSYGGAFASIVPPVPAPGLAWDTSTLATDGTLRLKTGVATNPTNITTAVVDGGGTLQLSWPEDHTGWTLQVQTNALSVGLSTNWFNVSGSAATNQMFLPIVPANGSVFYRLVY